jgi:hypothetical protein
VAVSNPSSTVPRSRTKGLDCGAEIRDCAESGGIKHDISALRLEYGRAVYLPCDLCSTGLACHSNTLHETSLTHAHLPATSHDLPARAYSCCSRRLFFFSKAHFTTACLAQSQKAFQSYEATWGIAPRCYCPTLPTAPPTHPHLHHPTQNSDSDSHIPPSSTRTSTVAAPRRNPSSSTTAKLPA